MKWIPCKDRLPKEFQKVLACRDGEVAIGYTFIRADGQRSYSFNGTVAADHLIKPFDHWMPIPNPA